MVRDIIESHLVPMAVESTPEAPNVPLEEPVAKTEGAGHLNDEVTGSLWYWRFGFDGIPG